MAGRDDRFEDAKKTLAAMAATLEKVANKAENDAKKQSELLANPQVKAALESAKVAARADAIRVDADAKAKSMKSAHAKAARAIARLTKVLDALATRPR